MVKNIDIISVTETFIDTVNIDLFSEYNIEGLTFFDKDCINRRVHVALCVVTWLNPVEVTL